MEASLGSEALKPEPLPLLQLPLICQSQALSNFFVMLIIFPIRPQKINSRENEILSPSSDNVPFPLLLSHFLTLSISPFLSLLANLAFSYFPFIFNSMFILSGAISLAFVPPAHTSYRVAAIKSKLGAKPPSSCDSHL